MKILIVADDLSGAADCAIGFAGAGHRAVVMLEASREQMDDRADTIAVDTDSRRLPRADAAARTVAAFHAVARPGQRLYKKIDSTLRGNWVAEVAALQPLAGLAIVAPAFPATGRTLRGGRVFVHGEPLESTQTWQLEYAGLDADVVAMLMDAGLVTEVLDAEALRDDPAALAERIAASAARRVQALVVDTQTEHALRTLARVTLESDVAHFWVGSGGLAREIAVLTRKSTNGAANPDVLSGDAGPNAAAGQARAPVLVMVGSLSSVSNRQCALLRERGGVAELVVPPAVLRDGEHHAQWAALRSQIGATLASQQDLLLRIGCDDTFDPAEGAQLSASLATLVEPHFAKAGGLIATGGETARAMLSAARISGLQLIEEVEAGVAVGRPLDASGTQSTQCRGIVTKAGAFGTEHALYAAWLRLRNPTLPDGVVR